jgi:hypothetical protein
MDKGIPRDAAISLRDSQNASSRLTLVLWPERTTDRFITSDFMMHSSVKMLVTKTLIAKKTRRHAKRDAHLIFL